MDVEVKIDKRTLPKDGQLIKWQTHSDQDNDIWKTGTYSDNDGFGLFLYNTSEKGAKRDKMWDVLHWKCLACDGTGYNSSPNNDTSDPTCPSCRD